MKNNQMKKSKKLPMKREAVKNAIEEVKEIFGYNEE